MNEIFYTKRGDYYLPDLTLPEQEYVTIGKYGNLRRTYLKIHRKGLYISLLTSCKLAKHLAEIEHQAQNVLEMLMMQMAEEQGITEELKEQDQLAWVGAMNTIKACAEEIIFKEIIYK